MMATAEKPNKYRATSYARIQDGWYVVNDGARIEVLGFSEWTACEEEDVELRASGRFSPRHPLGWKSRRVSPCIKASHILPRNDRQCVSYDNNPM
jgi:hypothetical protein